MAICRYCEKEMTDHVSCNGQPIEIEGKGYDPIPYANEQRTEPHNCHDCGTPLGGYHHANCDMERCPKCGGQLISCGCIETTESKYLAEQIKTETA